MNPIIGADVTLDVLALGSDFKPWGAIIDALDLASWAVSVFSGGRAEVNYRIDIVFSSEIKLVGGDSKDGNDAVPAEVGYNFASEKFNGNVALQGIIEGKIDASVEIQAYVKKEKNKRFDGVIKEKDKEKAFNAGLGLEANSWVSLTLGKDFGENNDFSTDFYFSGVNLKVWVKFGFNKEGKDEPNLIHVVPDAEEQFDILKNTGEHK